MNRFSHQQLDGVYSRLVGAYLLEMRDPNDGQDPAAKSRHQYVVCDGLLFARRLPPEAVGDRWLGESEPPAWESCGPLPADSILSAWLAHGLAEQGLDWIQPPYGPVQEPGLVIRLDHVAADPDARYRCVFRGGREGPDDGAQLSIDAWDWPQAIWCPDCNGRVVWDEAGHVPGWRTCAQCGSAWELRGQEPLQPLRSDIRQMPLARWTMRRGRLY